LGSNARFFLVAAAELIATDFSPRDDPFKPEGLHLLLSQEVARKSVLAGGVF